MFESLAIQDKTKVLFNIIGEDIVRIGTINFNQKTVITVLKSYNFSDINIIGSIINK